MILEHLVGGFRSLTGRHPSESGWGGFWGDSVESATGLDITPFTALSNSAFYQGANLKATMLATISVHAQKKNARGHWERDYGSKLYDILRYEPNREATAFTHQQAQYLNKILWGNMYAEIERDATGDVVALWHLPSWLVTPHRVYKKAGGGLTTNLTAATPEDRRRGGEIWYEVRDGQGGKPVWLDSSRMKHVPGLSFNGLVGFSCIAVAAESIGVGLAIQKSAATIFGNAGFPEGVLERPTDAPPLSPNAERTLIAAFEARHKGVRKAGRVAVLQEGTAYKPTPISMRELRLVEAYKNNVPECARVLNIPAYFLSWEGGSSTPYSNVENEWTRLVRQSLQPEANADEQEIRRKLIAEDEAGTRFAEYELKTLLKGDNASRAAYLRAMYDMRAVTNGEIARLEGLPPVPEEEDDYKPAGAPSLGNAPDSPQKQSGELKDGALEGDDPAEPAASDGSEGSADDTLDQERAAIYAAPLRNLLTESLRRGVTREIRELRRAVERLSGGGRLSEFLAWAEGEYRDGVPSFLAELAAPALGADQARAFAEAYARRHIAELRTELTSGEPERIVALLDRWSATAAAEAAEREIALLTQRVTARTRKTEENSR